jgi:hypothetical protein
MKLVMLFASAHHVVVAANMAKANKYKGLRPIVSLTRPKSGLKAVDVSINAVDNQDAALLELK